MNSAEAVALPTSAAAAHEDDLANSLGNTGIGAQEQGDVGERCERDEGDPAVVVAAIGGLEEHVAQQLDGVPRVGLPLRLGPVEVAHAVLAVDVPGVDGLLQQRAVGTPGDGHVGAVGGVQDGEGVGDHRVHCGVAAHAGHGAQVEGWVQRGEEQRTGVVDAGVDVEDDGNGHAAILPEASRSPTGPWFRRGRGQRDRFGP